jgi:hypothetical protein
LYLLRRFATRDLEEEDQGERDDGEEGVDDGASD